MQRIDDGIRLLRGRELEYRLSVRPAPQENVLHARNRAKICREALGRREIRGLYRDDEARVGRRRHMAEPLLELLGGSGSCLLPREIRGDAAVILDAETNRKTPS